MAYREQEKQQTQDRNAQRKLKVEIVEHSRSELNETADRYYDRKTYKGGNPAGGENTAW